MVRARAPVTQTQGRRAARRVVDARCRAHVRQGPRDGRGARLPRVRAHSRSTQQQHGGSRPFGRRSGVAPPASSETSSAPRRFTSKRVPTRSPRAKPVSPGSRRRTSASSRRHAAITKRPCATTGRVSPNSERSVLRRKCSTHSMTWGCSARSSSDGTTPRAPSTKRRKSPTR